MSKTKADLILDKLDDLQSDVDELKSGLLDDDDSENESEDDDENEEEQE